MDRSKVTSFAIAGGLAAAWLILHWAKPAWAVAIFKPWTTIADNHGIWVVAVGGALLVALMGSFLWGLFGPRKHRNPEDAMAMGCLSVAAFALGGVMVVFLLCAIFRVHAVTNLISYLMIALAVWITPAFVWEKLKDWRKARANREKWVRPEQIVARFAGKTHVVARVTAEPKREFRELRYYAPDGRMVGFEEENGIVTASPATVTWRTDQQGLVAESSLFPGKLFRYTIMVRIDGNISYYLYEPGTPTHGWLAFRTLEIREGEPQLTATAKS